jgi:hypothetical protein
MEKFLHEINKELIRWRDILSVPYQNYILSK